ncbi:MAG: glycosyltransferase family 9 protein, partial [Bdellovibrionales bacterium]|nr:glycosyltransferase family 9 protein [Bdellovibrionales bacterium]
MKILIVSLLRLGDVLLALPLLESIRKENPEAEIHFLVNRSSEGLEPIVPYVKSWHYFNRIELQKGLGEYQTPIFDSYHQLAELVDKLNSEKFDRLINLTQNRLSGWLCAAIDAEDKLGFVLSRSGGIRYGSSWFRYLNDYGAGGAKDIFHYSDIFSYGAGYVPSQKVELNETQQGWKEAADILGTDSYEGPLVILQALTSDNKKDWGLNHWAEMAICLKGLLPKSRVIALGANFEQEKIETLIEKCLEKKIKIEKAICSLPTALSLLNRSHLLITGDTSIKHLAGFTNCSVIELSMGSSDYRKTGIYRGGNLILQALESCAPCSHTQSCFHKDPICRDKISPILVALVAKSLLADNKEELLALTRKWREKVDILKTHFTSSGYWMATN